MKVSLVRKLELKQQLLAHLIMDMEPRALVELSLPTPHSSLKSKSWLFADRALLRNKNSNRDFD